MNKINKRFNISPQADSKKKKIHTKIINTSIQKPQRI